MTRTFTLTELAARLDATVDGDGRVAVERVATLHEADGRCITWVGDERRARQVADSGAAAFLLPLGLNVSDARPALRVPDVDAAMIKLLTLFAPPIPTVAPGIHATATVAPSAVVDGAAIGPGCIIEAGAQIGPGTQIHPGVYVGSDSVIGRDCVLWHHVVIRERVTIGNRVTIHAHCTIGTDGFGYIFRDGRHQKVPQIGTVSIEDDVEIGANSCIDRAKTGVTRVGRGTKVDNLVQIAHNVDIGRHCILAGCAAIAGSVVLEDFVVLAGQVGVADRIRIGAGSRIAAQAGIHSDIPPGSKIAGAPGMDAAQYWRQMALCRRLPELIPQLRDLLKRVEQLESAANDRAGS